MPSSHSVAWTRSSPATREWTPLDRTRHRFESADGTARCYLAALSELSGIAGGASIHASQPVQRYFRDLLAMRNHPTAACKPFASVYVQNALGVAPPPFDRSAMSSLVIHG
jgi:hypothetical protein